MSGVWSAAQLSQLANDLGAVEDWLIDKCESRHHEDMADVVGKALLVIEDLYDEQREREAS